VAEDSAHHHTHISLYMVIPAHLLARWWALGSWGKRLCVEETGACGGEQCDRAEGERGGSWGREDDDWRVRGRMDEEMGNEYTEISDRSKGGDMIEPTMTVSLSPHTVYTRRCRLPVRSISHIYQASSPGLRRCPNS
jgi:hypothetical protein